MDRSELSRLAHQEHPVAAPVSERRVDQLVGRLVPPDGGTVLDLGCGQAAWLLSPALARPGVVLRGGDASAPALAWAQATAGERRVDVDLVLGDAASWSDGLHDAVICVGASHVFGGLTGTLDAVRRHLRPGGRALVEDTI